MRTRPARAPAADAPALDGRAGSAPRASRVAPPRPSLGGRRRSLATRAALLLLGASVACHSAPQAPPAALGAELDAQARRSRLVALLERTDRGLDRDGFLTGLLEGSDPALRERAAWALGQLAPDSAGGPEATAALARALAEGPEPALRRAAAFALGQRRDPAAAPALLAALSAEDPALRALVVEAASRIDEPSLHRELPFALYDPDARVRRQAALAAHRLAPDAPDAAELDHALLEALRGAPDGSPQPDEVERALYFSLARRTTPRARAAFLAGARERDAEARLFALAGLAALAPEVDELEREESHLALVRACADPDWRVAVEALNGLGRRGDPRSVPTLASALAHSSAHVRRAAALALGGQPADERAAQRALESALADRSPWVRSGALVALARLLAEDALEPIRRAARAEDARLRVGAAEASAHLPLELALPLLRDASTDPEARVRWSAVEALARFAAQEPARELLHELVRAEDAGLRLGAVLALAPDLRAEELPLLSGAAHGSGGLESEIAFEALEAAARLDADAPLALLRAQVAHPDPYVAGRARVLLAERGAAPHEGATTAAWPERRGAARALLEEAADLLLLDARPRLALETERGRLLVELAPDSAPLHVANVLALARAGHYDGLVFHRVVSDFVVQGGDLRGDGNGAAPVGGRALRRELSPVPFERGALGMPRNADPDSGGSQLFLTHRATPHLDGRFALLGALIEGEDVLDRIEAGDRILSARALETR